MTRSSKPDHGRTLARWAGQLLSFSLLLLVAACSSSPGDIGVGLPDANANTGAYLVDTLTVRASTVLRDSLATSSSTYLFVGQHKDQQLGTITAKSYVTFGLGGSFTPDQTQVFDSVALVLKPDNATSATADTYRYGDTTRTQTLVEVRELNPATPISSTKASYVTPKLTTVSTKPGGGILNYNYASRSNVAPVRRAQRTITTLRLPLDPAWGLQLLNDAKSGLLTSQEQFEARYPGLVLLPGTTDEGALVRFTTTATDAALVLYYHDPTALGVAEIHSFPVSTGRHFYQMTADRTSAAPALLPLTTTLQSLDASRTSQQVYIEGALGLQTKLEFPYLNNLRSFGRNLVITSATMTAEVPTGPVGLNVPPPASLTVSLTTPSNQQGRTFVSEVDYNTAVSNLAGVPQAGYTWSILEYCQAVLSNSIQNNGMLLASSTPALPARVILGGPRRSTNKLQLRLYIISNGE